MPENLVLLECHYFMTFDINHAMQQRKSYKRLLSLHTNMLIPASERSLGDGIVLLLSSVKEFLSCSVITWAAVPSAVVLTG